MIKEGINRGEIIIYDSKDGPKLEVLLKDDTVWLTLNQMASLFERDKSVISRHLKNIFQTGELTKNSTVAFFATVQNEGGRLINRQLEYYNLDVIISVGYRVNSKQATQFRIWATKTLREHIIKGYTINENRLLQTQNQLKDLQETIALLQEKSKHELLAGQEYKILYLIFVAKKFQLKISV
jgi:hypothetical protein